MTDITGFILFVLAILIFLGWFAVGTQYNVRRGNQLVKWLQEGLPLLGEKSTFRWLGSSAVELKIQKPRAPFRQVEVFVLLEPRDVPFWWFISRMRGRRDMLLVRAHLRQTPAYEFEVFQPSAWATRSLSAELQASGWKPLPSADPALAVFAPDSKNDPVRPEAVRWLDPPETPLLRLGVHREVPNLLGQWALVPVPHTSSKKLFESLLMAAGKLGV